MRYDDSIVSKSGSNRIKRALRDGLSELVNGGGPKGGLHVRDPPFGQSLQVVRHFVTPHIKYGTRISQDCTQLSVNISSMPYFYNNNYDFSIIYLC